VSRDLIREGLVILSGAKDLCADFGSWWL